MCMVGFVEFAGDWTVPGTSSSIGDSSSRPVFGWKDFPVTVVSFDCCPTSCGNFNPYVSGSVLLHSIINVCICKKVLECHPLQLSEHDETRSTKCFFPIQLSKLNGEGEGAVYCPIKWEKWDNQYGY